MADEIIHVGIKEPKQHRKEILSLTVDIIQLLKKYEKYKKIEKEKNLYRIHLTKNIKQLTTTLTKFQTMIPQVHMREKRKEKKEYPQTQPQKIIKQKKEIIKKPVIKNKELEKLETDIASIRSKINKL